jgi:DeoR family transcriptional regulator, aga operon transcriptional repressor
VDRYTRLNSLLELLTKRGRLDIEEVAAELDVSAATIRRDFDHLAEQQLVTRTRGGAVSAPVSYDLPLRYKASRNVSEKQRIGAATASLLPAGCVVGLTGGTTATEVARAVAAGATVLGGTAGQEPTTIVTNAVNIAGELMVRPHVRVVLTGGVARPQSYELIGPLAERTLADLSLDVAVLGVDAVDPDFGASTRHEGEAAINALIASRARQVIVVADSSKLAQRAFARVWPVSAMTTLVTDDQAPAAVVTAFERLGVRVIPA